MRSRMRLVATALTLTVGFTVGCASDPSFDLSRDSSYRATDSGASSGNIWNRGSSTVTSAAPSSTASPTESIARVFQQVSTKVSDTFELSPRTVSATDPAQLSSRPEKLSPALYVRAAAWSENQGATNKAQQQYQKALELDPRNVKTLVVFARFHDRQGHNDEALQLYSRALELAPNNVVVLNDVGIFHARRRQFTPGLEALGQAVQLAPHNARYRNNLAGVLVQSGRPDDAVTVLRSVHSDAVANLNVGHFLTMERDFDQATVYFRRAEQTDPSLVAAREAREQIGGNPARNNRSAPYLAQTGTAQANLNGSSNPYRPASLSHWAREPQAQANGPRRLPLVQ